MCWTVAGGAAVSVAVGNATTHPIGCCPVCFSSVAAAEKPIVNASFKQTSDGQAVA